MKKLMIILTAALSFGLFADALQTGVNFEAFDVGAFDFSMTDNGQPLAINDKAYWIYGEDADGTITEEAERYTQNLAPDAWKNITPNEKFLHLDGGLVYRTALSCISEDNERNNIATQAADPDTVVSFGENPVYFDTMVKFTAFEDLPTAMSDDQAKLAVFAYAPEGGDYTNLVISGGYVGQYRTFTNYVTDVAVDLSKWYRLTVRALNVGKSGNEPAFLVYLDEELVSRREGDDCGLVAENLNAIGAKNSASIVPSFKTGVEVCAMGFSGTGDIDDLSITDVKPGFIVEESTYTINWSEGVATLKIDDGDAFAVEGSGSTNVALAAGATAVTITATYADGYERGTWKQGSEPVDGNEFEDVVGAELYIDAMIPLYDIGGKHYASVQDMLAAAKTGDTVKLLADVAANVGFPEEVTEITIDLAGHTITGALPDRPVISGGAEALVTIINSTEEIGSVVPTYNESSWDEVLAVVSYDVTIYGGIFDGPVTADNLTVVEGGQFYQPEAEAVEDFYLVVGEIVAPEDVTYIGDNYFQVGEAPVPQIKLSWNEKEAVMTVLVSIDGYDVTDNPAVVETGDVAEFIVLPKVGYQYATAPDGWFLRIDGGISNNFEVADESITVEIPEPTAIPVATYEVTVAAPYEHSTVSVMGNDKTEYGATGGVYTISADVAITVSYQADSGYQFVDGAKQLWDFDADSEDKETTAPVVEAIEYAITYIYGEQALTGLEPTSYNIEDDDVALPEDLQLTGVTLEGWYDNEDLEGDPVTVIAKGSTGEKTFYAKTSAVIDEVQTIINDKVDGYGELGEDQQKAVYDNVREIRACFSDVPSAEQWITTVYGDDAKIPAAKLAASTPELVGASMEYNLPIMTTAVEITVTAAAEGVGFTFAITDGGDPVSVKAADLYKLVMYTGSLEDEFKLDLDKKYITFDKDADATFTARFIEGPAAGFMKAVISGSEEE